MLKLGILATHPIQYHAPLFRELAKRDGVDLTVYFCHRPTAKEQGEGFGVAFEWDVDLLSGYRHVFLKNRAPKPAQGFFGYDTPEIAGIIRREKFDFFIVHGWAWKSCWQAFRACWKNGTRLGVRSDSQLPRSTEKVSRLKSGLKKIFYPRFIGKFDVCFPYGERSAAYFQYYHGKNIVVAPHFVDNDWFAANVNALRSERAQLRRNWNIPEDAFCFLFCGKFEPKKRPLDILAALKLLGDPTGDGLNSAKRSVHLLMVGDGQLRRECEEFAQESGLPVTFAGFLNQGEIPQAYVAADSLILPSSKETWGLVVNEAMACGLPVIVSEACGCVPDLIRADETGFSFACGMRTELVDRMARFAFNPTLCQKMTACATEHIEAFSAKMAADTLLKAFTQTTEIGSGR